jgi:bacteriocin biosynthesis cyclodehydratase domain-containing protein
VRRRIRMGQLHVLAVGAFGHAVATLVDATLPGATVHSVEAPGGGPLPAGLHGVVVVVAGRPVPALTDRVDAWAAATGTPWLPVVVEGTALRAGPLVVPGESACHRCFRGRLRQHAAAPAVEAALDGHYRTGTADEPYGYLPGTAAVAADLIATALADRPAHTGRVRQRDLVSGRLSGGHVVGVHGCDRCGLLRDESTRSSAELYRSLSEVLRWTS